MIWPDRLVCGVCVLRRMVLGGAGQRQLFGDIKPSMIKLIKNVCHEKALGKVTWHGFRRGRTVDLAEGYDNPKNPKPSLMEIYGAGGWKPGSASPFAYIPSAVANKQRAILDVTENSDTEDDIPVS